MDILNFIYSFFPSILLSFVILYGVAWIIRGLLFIKRRANRISGKEEIYKLLTSQLEQNLIKDKKDIEVILNSINREYGFKYSITSILEDYIVYNSRKTINYTTLIINYELLKNILLLEKQEIPYNNVPDEEKRILININDSIKYKDFDSIKFNIKELSSIIATKAKNYERTQRINKLSIPIAVIGMILTVIFGLF